MRRSGAAYWTDENGSSWEQKFKKRYRTSAATWGDIKRCMTALSHTPSKFSPLRRAEGGFMCYEDTNFRTTEPHGASPWVRKAIRFVRLGPHFVNWPASGRLFDEVGCDDDHVVIRANQVVSLRFEGNNCDPWTRATCDELARIIATSLNWTPTRIRHGFAAARRGAR